MRLLQDRRIFEVLLDLGDFLAYLKMAMVHSETMPACMEERKKGEPHHAMRQRQ